MTKLLAVICFLVITTFSLSFFVPKSWAEYFLRPIPDYPESKELVMVDNYPNAPIPVTFGNLLDDSFPTITPTISDVREKTEKLKNFLAQIDPHNPQPITHNKVLGYYDSHPTPSPFPTITPGFDNLIAKVDELTENSPGTGQKVLGSRENIVTENRNTNSNIGEIMENPVKTTYTIALLGDSMTDTLGRNLPHLQNLLKQAYPKYSFALLNYGQGATDMESGLSRLTNSTKYLEVDYPPLLSYNPDIVVVESFGYNHWSTNQYDLDRHWLTIARIIDTVKKNSLDTKIILAATIGPNSRIYGDGSLNWNTSLKEQGALATKVYLQNLVNFATSENYPLADAYHASIDTNGEGKLIYINGSDHLHPSNEGAYLYSQKIVDVIKEKGLIK